MKQAKTKRKLCAVWADAYRLGGNLQDSKSPHTTLPEKQCKPTGSKRVTTSGFCDLQTWNTSDES
jgi:hypothetical protein